jgi:hypothetical protein
MPYVAEKVIEMFYFILRKGYDFELPEVDSASDNVSIEDIKSIMSSAFSDIEVLKTKVHTVGRIGRLYKNLRENSDAILKIKMVNDGRIPRGLLLQGKPAIRNALKDFARAS